MIQLLSLRWTITSLFLFVFYCVYWVFNAHFRKVLLLYATPTTDILEPSFKRNVLSYNSYAKPWLQSEISLQRISSTDYVWSMQLPCYHGLLLYDTECWLSPVMHVIILDGSKVWSRDEGVGVSFFHANM